MTVTAQAVFTSAMNLMDEVSSDGTFAGYDAEYKTKAWSILTTLQAELLKATDIPTIIIDETSTFMIDDRSCLMILPYGLASLLLLTEDQNRSSFFNSRYEELKRKRPASIISIVDVYGVSDGSDSTDDGTTTDTSGTGTTGTSTDTSTTIDGGDF